MVFDYIPKTFVSAKKKKQSREFIQDFIRSGLREMKVVVPLGEKAGTIYYRLYRYLNNNAVYGIAIRRDKEDLYLYYVAD